MSKNFISQKGFSYAEAMVTMLIVAIIMVATTPIITKKANTHKGQIWSWSDGGNGSNTFFGTGASQRVIIGKNSAGSESAKLIVYSAADNRNLANPRTLPPIVRFNTIRNNNPEEIGRITTTNTSLGIGRNALEDAQGDLDDTLQSTAVGAGALRQMTAPVAPDGPEANNTAIGFNACNNITVGTNNICIGANSGPTSNVSNQLFIDTEQTNQPLIHADFLNDTVTINGQLNLGNINNVGQIINNLAGGVSDARLKNIKGNSQAGLKEINKLQIKNYTYKKDKEKIPHVGVIAQELQKVFPNAVTKDKDGYLRIRQEDMFYAMINAIKELDLKFNKSDEKTQELEQEISNLKEENAKLLQRLEALEQKIGE
ncbi:tail fiber domain-containing protein [bacterium]|nr:tail fiber domain-containing protein [bacterium]